jgi:MFS family permease
MFGNRKEFLYSEGLSPISGIVGLPQWRYAMLFAAIFAGNAICALIYDALPPILPQLAQHFGGGKKGENIAQLASTLPLAGIMVAGLLAGSIIERLGTRLTLIFCLILFGITGSAGAVLDNASVLLGLRLLMGMCVGVAVTASTLLVTMHFQGGGRAVMTGRLTTIGCISGILLIYLSGFLASTVSWRAPFLLHGVLAGVILVPVWCIGPDRQVRPASGPVLDSIRRLRPALPAYLLAIAFFIINNLYVVQLVFLMDRSGVAAPLVTAVVFSLLSICVAMSSALYGRLARRFTTANFLTAAFLILALSLTVAAPATVIWEFALAMMLAGIGTGMTLPAAWTLVMKNAPADLSARALGLMTSVSYLGGAIAPEVLHPIRQTFDLRGEYLFVAALVAVTTTVLAALRYRSRLISLRAASGASISDLPNEPLAPARSD